MRLFVVILKWKMNLLFQGSSYHLIEDILRVVERLKKISIRLVSDHKMIDRLMSLCKMAEFCLLSIIFMCSKFMIHVAYETVMKTLLFFELVCIFFLSN